MASLFTARPWAADRHKYVVLAGREEIKDAKSASTFPQSYAQSKIKTSKIWPIMLSAAAIVLTALIASTYVAL
jgi:hypothetical protein